MSARYTQSKSEAARHQEILKGMLKQPENKVSSPPPPTTRYPQQLDLNQRGMQRTS